MQSAKYAKCKNMQSAKIFKVQKYANIWVKQRAEISLMECGVQLEGPKRESGDSIKENSVGAFFVIVVQQSEYLAS